MKLVGIGSGKSILSADLQCVLLRLGGVLRDATFTPTRLPSMSATIEPVMRLACGLYHALGSALMGCDVCVSHVGALCRLGF